MQCVRVSIFAALAFATSLPTAQTSAADGPAKKKAFDIEHRQLWTTNNIHGSPEPPDPYTTENAFPNLKLFEPLSVGLIPGRNSFGVATRPGKIVSFEIKPDVKGVNEILDLKRTVYGLVF